MPLWSLLTIALATTGTPPGPAVADCAGLRPLAVLLADPAYAMIELEAGCDHPVNNVPIAHDVAVVGQVPVSGVSRPRVVFTSGAAGGNLFGVTAGTVSFEALDLHGLDDQGQPGGRALHSTGGVISFFDVGFSEFSGTTYGGAMRVDDSVVTIEGGTLDDNSGHWGGVVWVDNGGDITFTGITANRNVATGAGGFAYVEASGWMRLFDMTAVDHTAPYGGFVAHRGEVVVDGLTSWGHTATTGAGGGFYVENTGSVLSLCNATLGDGSAATTGGAISARGATTIGKDCALSSGPGPVSFADHSATTGGGIYALGASADLTVHLATFTNHSATGDGGTIYAHTNTTDLSEVVIEGSSALARGGAIYLQTPADFDLSDSQIRNASAGTYGGGLELVTTTVDTTRLNDLELENCSAGHSGGGLHTSGGFTADGMTVRFGQASVDGGGIHLNGAIERTLSGLTITDSYAAEEGGGISLQSTNGVATTLSDVVVERCDATNGGALAIRDSTATVDGFRFEDSLAAEGGAVFVHGNNASADLSRGLVCGTTSGIGSITAWTTSPTLLIDQVGFVGNSGFRGAGIEVQDSTATTLSNLHFVGNEATYGAALFVEEGVGATLTNVVVVDNHSTSWTSGAIDGLLPDTTWYEGNTPLGNPDDPLAVDTSAGMLFDGSCTWAALRTVDRAELGGVWGPVTTDLATWPDGTDPFRDADLDGVPWLHDCDDDDEARNHVQPELCDGIDNDCDGLIDDDDDSLDPPGRTPLVPGRGSGWARRREQLGSELPATGRLHHVGRRLRRQRRRPSDSFLPGPRRRRAGCGAHHPRRLHRPRSPRLLLPEHRLRRQQPVHRRSGARVPRRRPGRRGLPGGARGALPRRRRHRAQQRRLRRQPQRRVPRGAGDLRRSRPRLRWRHRRGRDDRGVDGHRRRRLRRRRAHPHLRPERRGVGRRGLQRHGPRPHHRL